MKSMMVINTMNSLYEQLVRYKEEFKENEGIYFVCKIESECYGYDASGNIRHDEWCGRAVKFFHVIILQNNKVFINIKDIDYFGKIPQIEWENTSNHNSCWRFGCDKLITLGFEIWDDAHKNCPKKFRPSTRDESIKFELGPSLTNIFKFVKADILTNNIYYSLSNITEIEKTITR